MVIGSSLEQLTNTVAQIITKLTQYGFVANFERFQYFSSDANSSQITINDATIYKEGQIKYLGVYIRPSGIAYENEISSKSHKALHAISTIKWTKYHIIFRDSFKLFFKSCLMPILGYGCELWSSFYLEKLKQASCRSLSIIGGKRSIS